MPESQTPDFKGLHEHHLFRIAEKAETRIDEARTALWAARTLIELLKSEAENEKQAELVDVVLTSVCNALGHLTDDVMGDCLGTGRNAGDSTAEHVGAMALAFDPMAFPAAIDAVLAGLHWRDNADDDDEEEGAR